MPTNTRLRRQSGVGAEIGGVERESLRRQDVEIAPDQPRRTKIGNRQHERQQCRSGDRRQDQWQRDAREAADRRQAKPFGRFLQRTVHLS